MKYSIIYLFIILIVLFQGCTSNREKELLDFQIHSYPNAMLSDSTFKKFVIDYINLPENIHRKVFTLYFDERPDTLLFTIWRYPEREMSIKNSLGFFKVNGRIVLLYSPFIKFINFGINSIDERQVKEIYSTELEYYNNHRHELVMWQLQYSYWQKKYFILKNYKRIINTTKAPLPDSTIVDIQWPAH
jgi:hypothetical protein